MYKMASTSLSPLSRSLASTSTSASLVRSLAKVAAATRPIPTAPQPLAQLCTGNAVRRFHTSPLARHGGIERPAPGTGIKITFRDSKGTDLKTVEANEGDDLLSIAHEYDIDLEGACEGSIACSTCHVILEPDVYDRLQEPCEDEEDMLDLAFGLTDTSRLGCQVKVTKDLDGMVAQLPSATRNMYVDGHKAGHH
ncbi:mitochondrial matrix iron-sulfur protein [Thecaphora frezii]